jgi:hypothetical protein
MQEYITRNTIIAFLVWLGYTYQLYRCIRFYKVGLSFPVTKISESSSGFGRFELNFNSNKPILHPVTSEPLAGFEIEFWIRDLRYQRRVGRKTFMASNLTNELDGQAYEIKFNSDTIINTQAQEY